MYRLFKLIKKNFKLLLRTKSSLLLIVLSPLLLVVLGGVAFNNAALHEVRLSLYDEGSGLGRDFLGSYLVQETQTLSECQDAVRFNEAVLCLALANGTRPSVDIFVDQSQYNLAYMVLKDLSEKLDSKKYALSTDFAATLFRTLNHTRHEIESDREIVTRLTKSHTEKKQHLEALTSGLENTSVETPEISSEQVSDIREQVDAYKTQSTFLLHKVKNELRDTNTTGNATAHLDSAIDLVEDLSFEGHIQQIEQDLEQIRGAFESIQDTVSAANTEVTEALAQARELHTVLEKDLSWLMDLQESFDRITDTSLSFDAQTVAQPIETSVTPLATNMTHFNYLFSGILVLFIMFVGILLASTLVIMEKTSKAFIRNVLTPTKNSVFILAGFLTTLLLLSFQILLLLGVLAIFMPFGLMFYGQLFGVLLLIATVFILAGMAIGYLFKTHESAILASIGLCAILLLFSGMLLPLESMPFASLAEYNPFVLGEGLVKLLFLYHEPHFLSESVIFLGGYAVILLGAIVLFHHRIHLNLRRKSR
ncbi:MAG: ABC transporter permease [Nanobdellota archaeon]